MRSGRIEKRIMHQAYQQACQTAASAGKLLMRHFGRLSAVSRSEKKDGELVTGADLASERLIKRQIKMTFPEHNFWGEETGLLDKGSEFLWVVDPLDGTTNFANGLLDWAVSIALFFQGNPVVGVICLPPLRRTGQPFLFSAVSKEGAFFGGLDQNNQKRLCMPKLEFNSHAIFYSVTRHLNSSESNLGQFVQGGKRRLARIRAIGASAITFVRLANGNAIGLATYGEKLVDVAAGSLIAQEAGGEVVRFLTADGSVEQTSDIFGLDRISEVSLNRKFTLLAAHPDNIQVLSNGLILRNLEAID